MLPLNNPWINFIQNTPGFQIFDQFMSNWFDANTDIILKMYYWPAFVAGSSDNIMDLFKPETYGICRV